MSEAMFYFWVILIVVVVAVVIVWLAEVPYKCAKKRGNPNAGAIRALSWIGMFFSFGILWIIALIWGLTESHVSAPASPALPPDYAQYEVWKRSQAKATAVKAAPKTKQQKEIEEYEAWKRSHAQSH